VTTQDAYDRMRAWFTQPDVVMAYGPSPSFPDDRGADTNCLYRAPNGGRCAIGCLIPNELYNPEMEGSAITALYGFNDTIDALFKDADIDFLMRAQDAHDESHDIPTFLAKLDAVARKHHLETA
jgi:hypothetical protein